MIEDATIDDAEEEPFDKAPFKRVSPERKAGQAFMRASRCTKALGQGIELKSDGSQQVRIIGGQVGSNACNLDRHSS